MADIRHRVGIAAPADRVYDALATREGLASWWTEDVRGDAGEGGELSFYFGGPDASAVMQVTEAVPRSRVAWRCVRGPDDWVGTDLSFEVSNGSDETTLLFTHGNWSEPVAFMHHCSTKWGYFLLTLKEGLEGGSFTPYPHDKKISSWG